MTLGNKQRVFTHMIAQLIIWAYEQGYEMTFGDAFRDPRAFGEMKYQGPYGRNSSCHKIRLAVDLNLFKDGKYLTETLDHLPIGEYWEGMGGTWGGRFDDGNHYSLEHLGNK